MSSSAAAPPSGARSLQHLPDEVVDMILERVDSSASVRGQPVQAPAEARRTIVKTICAVSLTCRSLRHPAQRALYRTPSIGVSLAQRGGFGQKLDVSHYRLQAWLLRKQLQDEPRLAHTVRDLSHLAELVKVLPTTAELNTEAYRFASAIDRSLVAEQYIESLAELCPNLEAVTTSLRNRDQAVRLGTSLSATKSLKSMKCKVFGDPRNLDAFFEALAKPNGAPLVQEVELEFRGLHHHAEPETPGGQPLPRDISSLRELRFRCDTWLVNNPEPEDLLPRLAGNRLTVFGWITRGGERYCDTGVNQIRGPLEDYNLGGTSRRPDEMPSISATREDIEDFAEVHATEFPVEFFRAFPAIKVLTLNNGLNMTLAKLAALADTSPSLVYLDLGGTLWDIGGADFSARGDKLSPFEADLVQTLERFRRLRNVDLGILPYEGGPNVRVGEREPIRRWATKKRIQLKFEGCHAEEPESDEERSDEDGYNGGRGWLW